MDELAGGSWMGLNDYGVVACILNRRGTMGPEDNKRSRGEIVLDALDHQDAVAAADSLAHLDGQAFRGFNLVVADNRDAYWLRLDPESSNIVEVSAIPQGISMLTAADLNDPSSQRIQAYLPQFESTGAPDPETNDGWTDWQALMAAGSPDGTPSKSMCFHTDSGFGTSSSALIALPSVEGALKDPSQRLQWLFAAGAPDSTPYEPIHI